MRVHLDHNATTPLRAEARARWLEVQDTLGGNPSSLHAGGRAARALVDDARERVAAALGAHEDEILFTSGGTESNNLALGGALAALGPGALVTSATEHSSVLQAASAQSSARTVHRTPVDRQGRIDASGLAKALADGAVLLSLAAANNETGALLDFDAVRRILTQAAGPRGVVRFHTDAVQMLGRLPVALEAWGVDYASFSAHKAGGPVGVGVLWRRRGAPLAPLLHGGGQEAGLRPGTENAAGLAAAAVAIELAAAEAAEFAPRARELVHTLWSTLGNEPGLALIGPTLEEARLPNTLCVAVPHTDGKVLVTRLDLEGVEASAGSACASGSVEPSHVLVAMGYDDDAARSGLRLSVGRETSHAECAHAARVLKKLVRASRAT